MAPKGGNTPRFMFQLTSIDFCPYISQYKLSKEHTVMLIIILAVFDLPKYISKVKIRET